MPILFRCPVCKHTLSAPAAAAGFTSVCPKCHTAVPVPLTTQSPEHPLKEPPADQGRSAAARHAGAGRYPAPAELVPVPESEDPFAPRRALRGAARTVAAGFWLLCALVALAAAGAVLVWGLTERQLTPAVYALSAVVIAYVVARSVERCLELFR